MLFKDFFSHFYLYGDVTFSLFIIHYLVFETFIDIFIFICPVLSCLSFTFTNFLLYTFPSLFHYIPFPYIPLTFFSPLSLSISLFLFFSLISSYSQHPLSSFATLPSHLCHIFLSKTQLFFIHYIPCSNFIFLYVYS